MVGQEFERIEREILADMIKKRDELDRAIAKLQYELANPPPPVDHDKVKAQVDKIIAEDKAHWKRYYQNLLEKEKAGTLDPGEAGVLKGFKLEML